MVLNMLGAIFVSISLLEYFNAAALTGQILWFLLSLMGMIKLYNFRKNNDISKLYLAFDGKTKELPTHFLLVENNKVTAAYDYSDKDIWAIIEHNEVNIIKGKYFSERIDFSLESDILKLSNPGYVEKITNNNYRFYKE